MFCSLAVLLANLQKVQVKYTIALDLAFDRTLPQSIFPLSPFSSLV
jgi:hypothetical protein